jgi:hypothetical protein
MKTVVPDFAGLWSLALITDPHSSVARNAAQRRISIITPAFPLAATRLPLGHLNLSGCSTASPDQKPI